MSPADDPAINPLETGFPRSGILPQWGILPERRPGTKTAYSCGFWHQNALVLRNKAFERLKSQE